MREHFESVHEGRRHACGLCPSSYSRRKRLVEHITMHAPKYSLQQRKRYVCFLCSYVSSHSSHLKAHMTSHIWNGYTNSNVAKMCKLCFKLCCNVKYLKIHIGRSHLLSSLMPHIESYLRGISSDRLEKERMCELCNYSSFYKGNLRRHMEEHIWNKANPRKPVCVLCNHAFCDGRTLKNHLKTVTVTLHQKISAM